MTHGEIKKARQKTLKKKNYNRIKEGKKARGGRERNKQNTRGR